MPVRDLSSVSMRRNQATLVTTPASADVTYWTWPFVPSSALTYEPYSLPRESKDWFTCERELWRCEEWHQAPEVSASGVTDLVAGYGSSLRLAFISAFEEESREGEAALEEWSPADLARLLKHVSRPAPPDLPVAIDQDYPLF